VPRMTCLYTDAVGRYKHPVVGPILKIRDNGAAYCRKVRFFVDATPILFNFDFLVSVAVLEVCALIKESVPGAVRWRIGSAFRG